MDEGGRQVNIYIEGVVYEGLTVENSSENDDINVNYLNLIENDKTK